jgi:hypothetical protein
MQPTGDIPHSVRQLFNAMKVVFVTNAALGTARPVFVTFFLSTDFFVQVTTYALVIYALAIAIHYTIDNEVWTRDVYGDPGPFPMRDFITYVRGGYKEDTGGSDDAIGSGVRSPNAERTAHFCVPGSGLCEAHKPQLLMHSVRDTVEAGMPGGFQRPGNGRTSSVNSIISIPSVAERRSQIVVLFEEVDRR